MSRFEGAEFFRGAGHPVQLLPFRFERRPNGQYLVSNIVGEFINLSSEEFHKLADSNVTPGDGLYEKAYASHLITRENQQAQIQLLAMRLRSRMAFLRQPTPLHIFVVTLRCEHSCPYCQVSRQSSDRSRFDMTEEAALAALKIAMECPAPRIKIEFQGGEPLLNFGLIKRIVEEARTVSRKEVQFVIASNLALLTDDMLDFCKTNDVLFSTSLDGPADLHNKNRPRPGNDSYQLAVSGIKRVQKAMGPDGVSALMTTTEGSLDRVEEIIDEYVTLGLKGIFLRPLSPYGFAIKTKAFQRYGAERWLAFYKRGLRHILHLNKRGIRIREFYASLLLQRFLTDRPIGFVDLRSPAGVGLGALVYNYDGKVFASDEGRMLAEMGDRMFELGHVSDATYRSLILSDKLVELVGSSLTQCAPECTNCVFESHCGADPTYHYATQHDVLGTKPFSEFCSRQKGVMRDLLSLLDESPGDAAVLRSWVAH